MEDVRLRQQAGERPPLRRLAAREAAGAVERDVGLGVEGVALEHDEPGVDAAAPERLGRRPRNAGRVDGAEDDAQRARHRGVSGVIVAPSLSADPVSVATGIVARLITARRVRVPVPVPRVGGGLGWSSTEDRPALRRPTRAGRSSAAPSGRA